MSVEIKIEYQGDLHCQATHAPSGAVITTDAPKDNEGRGESFSPTDLVATALGACMVTIMGIVARRNHLPIEGTTVSVLKEMVQQPVRRIGKLTVVIRVKNGNSLSENDRKKLELAAHTCPVHKSLNPEIETPITFEWNA